MASSATDSSGTDRIIRQKLVKSGHVDVMVSVSSNFFYTKSLPCSLWFFDKGKPEELRDRVLFIDARDYYTMVERTLNEWSEWQLKNLNAIVWLYRGETEKYTALLEEYRAILGRGSFAQRVEELSAELKTLEDEAKKAVAEAARRESKKVRMAYEEQLAVLEETLTTAKEAVWLYDKFGDGEYRDVPGLCKVARREDIEERGWSLSPGAYVGVAPVEDDGVDFTQRMAEIHRELLELQKESDKLMRTISRNWEGMGL